MALLSVTRLRTTRKDMGRVDEERMGAKRGGTVAFGGARGWVACSHKAKRWVSTLSDLAMPTGGCAARSHATLPLDYSSHSVRAVSS